MKRPGRLEITTKIGCNINCVYCPQKLLLSKYFQENKERKSLLSLEDFKMCIDKLPKGTRIDFSGMAEPWLNEYCTDMVCYAAEKGFPIAVYTTLVGMTKADFNRIKKLDFEEFVLHIPDDKSNAHITITDEYIELLHEVIGYKKNGIELVTGYSCHAGIHPDIINAIPEGSKLITDLIDRAGNLEDDYVESKENTGEIVCINCEDDINHNVLLPDGTIVLCCMDYGMKHVIGNLLMESYEDIQNSEEAYKVRNGLAGTEEDVLCRNCTNARSIHEMYEEFKLYQKWCKNLLSSEKMKEQDLKAYKQWVANLQKKESELECEIKKIGIQYEERIKELNEYSDWVKSLQNKEVNLEKEIIKNRKQYEEDIRRIKSELDKEVVNSKRLGERVNQITGWKGYRLLACFNDNRKGM